MSTAKKKGKEPTKTTARSSAPAATGSMSLRLSSAAGLVVAGAIAVLLNVLSARHYRRWDWTEVGLYTLSTATEQTLAGLGERVDVVVLLPDSDPLTLTLRHLLDAYRAHSDRLEPRFVDPDRSPAELLAAQQKYGIVAGKTDAGQLVTDAAIVVARGDRKHFVTSGDLIEVEQGDELRSSPRVEQVLTAAIRQVQAGEPPHVCFTSGHGEPSLEEGGAEGLLAVRGRLEKSNYHPEELPALRDLKAADSIAECKVVVVAAPSQPMGSDEIARLTSYVESGGSALVLAGPVPDEAGKGYVDVGLAPLLALAGVKARLDFVFERDDARRSAQGFGETFMAEPRPHPITQGFVEAGGAVPIVLTVAGSLTRIVASPVEPTSLLVTSEQSFGMVDFFAWAESPREPELGPRDNKGPLDVAFAAELPNKAAAPGHGPRIVVVGSSSAVYGANWQNDQLRGTAMFVESAVSWLASEPIVLDIPKKPARPVGLNVTEEVLRWAFIKLVLLLPLAMLLLGAAITLRRRATEGKSRGLPSGSRGGGEGS